METSLNVYDYPNPPEERETNLQIFITISTTDVFPKEWDEEEIESYVKANISDYMRENEIEINEIEIWR